MGHHVALNWTKIWGRLGCQKHVSRWFNSARNREQALKLPTKGKSASLHPPSKTDHKTFRQKCRARSNNEVNPNKNICCHAVAAAFGVADTTRYLHNLEDIERALRFRYSVRSVASYCETKSVGRARTGMTKLASERPNLLGFIARVEGHVLAFDRYGNTSVDTAPRKRDRRPIKKLIGVYRK